MSKRLARMNEHLKRELSELIRTQVRDPRVGVVTITGVDVARDLGSARVFVRELGGEAELAETLAGLQAAAPFLRSELGKFMRVRRVPELRFQEDRSLEGAMRIEKVLSEVLPDEPEGHDDGGDAAEAGPSGDGADGTPDDADEPAGDGDQSA